MKKENLMPAIVLTSICLVVAALLGVVNLLTKDTIAENDAKALQASLTMVLDAEDFEEVDPVDTGVDKFTVKKLYRDKAGAGVVVVVSTTAGYTGKELVLTVGVGKDGKVTGVVVTNNPETKNTAAIKAYPDGFVGKSADEIAAVDLVSGVTYSSTAYRTAVKVAVEAAAKVQ